MAENILAHFAPVGIAGGFLFSGKMMIKTTVNRITKERIVFDAPVIYAIYDDDRRVAYVGQSKNLPERMKSHSINSPLRLRVKSFSRLAVDLYLFEDVEMLAKSGVKIRENHPIIPWNAIDENGLPLVWEEWADAAETLMCQYLKPYLNKNKTFRTWLSISTSSLNSMFGHRAKELWPEIVDEELSRWDLPPDIYKVAFSEMMKKYK